ncbi:hypothetical protein L6164_024354 [Bauhinia variegata]|uniref:Uncharacterized protein n=1 Tax=Bauhinia variegata TaxID=167791 RepID=A0ACB9LXK4_BAUVA|nr:hypothetical protein L6164_024354 [Bauhinia variegata]
MLNDYHCRRQLSLRHKLKSSFCCFSGTIHAHHESLENGEYSYDKLQSPKTPRTPRTRLIWHKKSGQEFPDSSRVRSRGLRSRIGHKHRQSHSGDFSYDPSSYALNFEDDTRTDDEEFPFRHFASRLPASPSPPSSANYKEDPPVRIPIVFYS